MLTSRRFGLLVCLLTTVGCAGQAKEDWPTALTSPDATAVSVTVKPVGKRPLQRRVEAVGSLYGFEEVSISTKVDGRVRRIAHDVADRVKPDDILLEIEPIDYELAARQAERALQVEWARLGLSAPPGTDFDVNRVPLVVTAAINVDNAKERLERSRKLSNGQAVAKEELADKAAAYRVAQAEHDNQLAMARAGLATVQMKQESFAIARQQLKDATVRVPVPTRPVPFVSTVNYVVTVRDVAEGAFVRSGSEVFRLVIEHPLKLRALVPERHAPEVKLGQLVEVLAAAFIKPFGGEVTRINPAVDPLSRTFEVEVLVPNPDVVLKPGGFAKAAILTRRDAAGCTVPLEALTRFAGITKIFLVENDTAKEVKVELGQQGTDWVEIVTPSLPEGALVVTTGQTALYDGVRVVVKK